MMIRPIPPGYWTKKVHPEGVEPRVLLGSPGQKWLADVNSPFHPSPPAREWESMLRLSEFEVYHAASRPTVDELFREAARKVNHKIEVDYKILGGAPCIAGTRIPVYAILQLVEAGYSHKRVRKSFPSLSQEDLQTALRFSAIVMER